jgi:hypothetical protein
MWLEKNDLDPGYSITLAQCWRLAQLWYRGRGERTWQRHDKTAARDIFQQTGLEGEFWNLE